MMPTDRQPTSDDLHKQLGRIIGSLQVPDARVILDSRDCSGEHLISLFCDKDKSRASHLCEVDAAIIVNGKVKVIIEIDTDDNPAHLCGKLNITTHARLASYGCDTFLVADRVSFIQVLPAIKTEKSKKMRQRKYLLELFQKALDDSPGGIRDYQIFYETKPGDFASQHNQQELIDDITVAVGR